MPFMNGSVVVGAVTELLLTVPVLVGLGDEEMFAEPVLMELGSGELVAPSPGGYVIATVELQALPGTSVLTR
jgi:hypothetical protein